MAVVDEFVVSFGSVVSFAHVSAPRTRSLGFARDRGAPEVRPDTLFLAGDSVLE